MNIVIPMAGEGRRFKEAGYKLPKPLIDVLGKPMICHVLDQFYFPGNRIILEVRQEHYENHKQLFEQIREQYEAIIVLIPRLTEGTACTVLEAYDYINNDEPLVIANSDQLVDIPIPAWLSVLETDKFFEEDGNILCFKSQDPKWSYIRYEEDYKVVEVVEKKVISDIATVGIYYFARGKDFVRAAKQMILADDRVNGEFYTAPCYNYLIREGMNIEYSLMQENQMHGLGTPEDLQKYLKWKSEN